ncbi:MAG: hypothetical protein IJG51_07385 [Synergistaceae bacterium]|nr:hypothetical protein [Synergistaceae bacterium]MBR0186576.1 hypothetical protein [Synergistaceae bacterium]
MASIYLALVLFVSVLGAATDICFGCVKNKHLITFSMIWLVLAVSELCILHSSSVLRFRLLLNVILSLVLAVIFYLTDIWAPGDCKLYIVISLTFPIRAYIVREGNIFPALDFVIYAFGLGYIFLLVTTFMRKTFVKKDIKLSFSLEHSLSIMFNAGMVSLLQILLNIFSPRFFYANKMLCILFSVALICLLQNKAALVRKIVGFTGLICLLINGILYGIWFNVCISIAESLVIASAIEFISNRVRINTYREIPGEKVRAGMILSFSTLCFMQKCTDPELPKTTTESRRSRLTRNQADAVKNWCKNSGSSVVIVEMMPFAPFLAGAVIIQVFRFLLLGH